MIFISCLGVSSLGFTLKMCMFLSEIQFPLGKSFGDVLLAHNLYVYTCIFLTQECQVFCEPCINCELVNYVKLKLKG